MKILAENKKGLFDYEVLETWDAGIVLKGAEVKSCRQGQINLRGSYISWDNQAFYLKNCHIAPYQKANQPDYYPEAPRKLLLRQKEINELIGKSKQKGLTLIPLKVYTKGGLIKVQFGLAKARKKYDKRELIKKREVERKIRQTIAGME